MLGTREQCRKHAVSSRLDGESASRSVAVESKSPTSIRFGNTSCHFGSLFKHQVSWLLLGFAHDYLHFVGHHAIVNEIDAVRNW